MDSREVNIRQDDAMLKTFAFLRFPLIVCVVLCHSFIKSAMTNAEVECFMNSSFLLSRIIARVAVPNFLFISGYLFFRNVDSFTPRLYCDKLKRRLRSLVVPYIFWNAAIILLYFIGQSLVPQLFSGNNTKVCDYSLVEWAQAFWRVSGTESPINYPLWYIRNLMVMVLLSPILYRMLKNRVAGALFIATMLCLWLSCLPLNRAIVWLTPKSLFFFSLGAWFSIHNIKMPRFRYWAVAVGILFYAASITGVFISRGWDDNIAYEMAILIGSVITMYVAHYGVNSNGWQVPKWLSSSHFFIFVFHAVPLALLKRLMMVIFAPENNVEYFAVYFACFILILSISIGVFYLLKLLFPKLLAIVLGNR